VNTIAVVQGVREHPRFVFRLVRNRGALLKAGPGALGKGQRRLRASLNAPRGAA